MKNMLIWQYRGKPKAVATIETLTNEASTVFKSAVALGDMLNIETATGWALDLVGMHVGMSRRVENYVPRSYFGWGEGENIFGWGVGKWYEPGSATHDTTLLDDDDFRFMIKAKILKNYQAGDLDSIIESVRFLFGETANVKDNYDMSMTIYIPVSLLNNFKIYAIKNMDILVRPVGVQYIYFAHDDKRPFGWGNVPNIYGWGVGIWGYYL